MTKGGLKKASENEKDPDARKRMGPLVSSCDATDAHRWLAGANVLRVDLLQCVATADCRSDDHDDADDQREHADDASCCDVRVQTG